MSSMIKKKGTLSFKPKAPQSRRQPGAPPSAPSSTRQSIERQSQTPAPPARQPAISPPQPVLIQPQIVASDLSSHHDVIVAREAVTAGSHQPNILSERSDAADLGEKLSAPSVEKGHHRIEETEQSISVAGQLLNVNNDNISSREAPTGDPVVPTGQTPLVVLEHPVTPRSTSEITRPQVSAVQNLAEYVSPDLSILGPGESDQPAAVIYTAELNADGTSGIFRPHGSPKNAKRPPKRRKIDVDVLDIRPTIEVQIHKPRRTIANKRKRSDGAGGETPRNKRGVTPEDAEEQEVDHSTMKMADLTKDLRIGRKFSKHAEIKQREVDKKIKAKMARLHPELIAGQADEDGNQSQVGESEEAPVEANAGPQMRIVNGQIVIDDSSLVVDRHAMAAATAEIMEEVEEDDFTRITTSGTFMKREKNVYWDFEATDKFYNAIRMFGTDFEMIAKMFPDRSRRQIKLKFNKEEKEFPQKIANALMRETVKIDLEEYKTHTGLQYEEVAAIEAEHALVEEEHNEEQRRMQAEAEEATRQKKAEIQGRAPATTTASASTTNTATGAVRAPSSASHGEAEASGAEQGGKSSAASKTKKKSAAKKKKRNLHSVRGGGEEVEVLGTLG